MKTLEHKEATHCSAVAVSVSPRTFTNPLCFARRVALDMTETCSARRTPILLRR